MSIPEGFRGFNLTCKVCQSYKPDKFLKCSSNCGSSAHSSCAISTGDLTSTHEDPTYVCAYCNLKALNFSDMEDNQISLILQGQESILKQLKTLTAKVESMSNDNCILKTLVDDQRKEIAHLRNELITSQISRGNPQEVKKTYSQSVKDARPNTSYSSGGKEVKNATTTSQQPHHDSAVLQSATRPESAGRLMTDKQNKDTTDADGYKLVKYDRKVSKQPSQIGTRNSTTLKVVTKVTKPRTKAIFVTRFDPSVTETDITTYIQKEISIDFVKVARLKTKYMSYASFHVAVAEKDFDAIHNTMFWPAGILINPFRGPLRSDQLYQEDDSLPINHTSPPETSHLNSEQPTVLEEQSPSRHGQQQKHK